MNMSKQRACSPTDISLFRKTVISAWSGSLPNSDQRAGKRLLLKDVSVSLNV